MEQSLPIINLKKTGANICALRKARGYSVKALQELFGFADPQAIYRWQWGKSLPSVDNLVILSHVLECPIESILVIDAPDALSGFYGKKILLYGSKSFSIRYA